MRHEKSGKLRVTEPHTHPVAGNPRLAHLEQRVADLVLVTDAHLVVGKPVDGEVLAELAVLEAAPAEVFLPVRVCRELVHQHGAVWSTMPSKVSLAIPVDVQGPSHA